MHKPLPSSVSFAAFLFLAVTCMVADAGRWASPDGALRVQRPDSARFQLTAPDDEFLVHWQSIDKLVQLGVLETSWNRSTPPRRKILERGFFNGNGLTRVASVTGKVDGREAWLMVGRADDVGYEYYMQQLVVPVNRKIYKLMAVSALHRPDSVPAIGEFFQSVQLAKEQTVSQTAAADAAVQPTDPPAKQIAEPEEVVVVEEPNQLAPVEVAPQEIEVPTAPTESDIQDAAAVPSTSKDPRGDAVEMVTEKVGFLLIPLMAGGLFFMKSRKRQLPDTE